MVETQQHGRDDQLDHDQVADAQQVAQPETGLNEPGGQQPVGIQEGEVEPVTMAAQFCKCGQCTIKEVTGDHPVWNDQQQQRCRLQQAKLKCRQARRRGLLPGRCHVRRLFESYHEPLGCLARRAAAMAAAMSLRPACCAKSIAVSPR